METINKIKSILEEKEIKQIKVETFINQIPTNDICQMLECGLDQKELETLLANMVKIDFLNGDVAHPISWILNEIYKGF